MKAHAIGVTLGALIAVGLAWAGSAGVGTGGLQGFPNTDIGTGSIVGLGCTASATGLNCVGVDAGAINVQGAARVAGEIQGGSTTTSAVLRPLMLDGDALPTVCSQVIAPNVSFATGDCIASISDANATNFLRVYQGGKIVGNGSAGTAGTGTGFTTDETGVIAHRVHKLTVTEAALTAAAGTEDETIWTVPAKTRVLRMIAEVTSTFSGGALTNMTMTCGTTAGGNQYLAGGANCDIGITETPVCGDVAAEIGAGLLSATTADIPSFSGTTAIQCRFTCTGANCVAATTGSVTFYIEHLVYP